MYQDDLIKSLEITFKSSVIPPDIVASLLDIAEFMEHHDQRLPFDVRLLSEMAERAHAHAKALRYKEMEFRTAPALVFRLVFNSRALLSYALVM